MIVLLGCISCSCRICWFWSWCNCDLPSNILVLQFLGEMNLWWLKLPLIVVHCTHDFIDLASALLSSSACSPFWAVGGFQGRSPNGKNPSDEKGTATHSVLSSPHISRLGLRLSLFSLRSSHHYSQMHTCQKSCLTQVLIMWRGQLVICAVLRPSLVCWNCGPKSSLYLHTQPQCSSVCRQFLLTFWLISCWVCKEESRKAHGQS